MVCIGVATETQNTASPENGFAPLITEYRILITEPFRQAEGRSQIAKLLDYAEARKGLLKKKKFLHNQKFFRSFVQTFENQYMTTENTHNLLIIK